MSGRDRTGGNTPAFRTTCWTRILRAKDPACQSRREDVGFLIKRYWQPVFFYIRQQGRDSESAKDLTQDYFVAFIEKNFLKDVKRERGRFRNFVLASLEHFLANKRDYEQARKRGGHFMFSELGPEIPCKGATPEEVFLNRWAMEVLVRAMDRLGTQVTPEDIALFKDSKVGGPLTPKEKRCRRATKHLLRRYLIAEVLPTLEEGIDPMTELRELFATF